MRAYPESCGSDPAEGGHQGSAKGQPDACVGRRHLQPLCGGSHVRAGHLAHAELKAPAHRTDFTTKIKKHPQDHLISCHTSLQVHWAGACDHAGLRAPAFSRTGLSLGTDEMHSDTCFEGCALMIKAVHDTGQYLLHDSAGDVWQGGMLRTRLNEGDGCWLLLTWQ